MSQRIKSLEKYLGTKLYDARGGKVRLTEAGHRTKALAANEALYLSRLLLGVFCCKTIWQAVKRNKRIETKSVATPSR